MAKATASSESIESGFETPVTAAPLEPLPPPPDFGGEDFSTRLPFVHPMLGQVIQGRIVRKATRPDKFNRDRQKQILVLELLQDFDNGATEKHAATRMFKGEQVQFDVRAGYGALFDLSPGDDIQLTNCGQTVDTGKGNKGWDWTMKIRLAHHH